MPGKILPYLFVVASALVPLGGVLAGSWSLREVVVLYWAENLVIGALQVVRMLTASPPEAKAMPAMHLGKVFLAGFFTVHYGFFCFVHGMFVMVLTSGNFPRGGPMPRNPFSALLDFPRPFWLALGLISASHLWTLGHRYFFGGKWRTASPQKLMAEPYKHIVVLHLGILLGAFLSTALGNPVGVLVIIVIGKLLVDLREVRKDESNRSPAPSPPTTA